MGYVKPNVKENISIHEFVLVIFVVKYSQLDITKTKMKQRTTKNKNKNKTLLPNWMNGPFGEEVRTLPQCQEADLNNI